MLSRIAPRITNAISKCLRPGLFAVNQRSLINGTQIASKFFGSNAYQELEQKFSKVLEDEIIHENSTFVPNNVPEGFEVTNQNGQLIEISKTYPDGCVVSVEINLAGSVSPDFESEGEVKDNVSVRPDIDIKLKKPNSKALIFHCVFPEQQDASEGEGESSCMIVESIELESIPGYFIYADVFDDKMYDNILGLLTERGLDDKFQEDLQAFCSTQEHTLYIRFLKDLKAFCQN